MFAIFNESKIMCVNIVNPKTSRWCEIKHAYNKIRGWKPYTSAQYDTASERSASLQRIYKGKLVVRKLTEDEQQQLLIAKLLD